MPTPIDPARLPAMKKAMKAFGPDEFASQQQLAEIYGVVPARMVSLIKTRFKGFPAGEARIRGQLWYPARTAIQIMIDYMSGKGQAKRDNASRVAKAMGAKPRNEKPGKSDASEEDEYLSAAELDRLANVQTKMWRLQKDQGLYVKADDMRRIAQRVNGLISSRVMNLINVVDPHGRLEADVRTRITRECKSALSGMYEAMGELLDDAANEPLPTSRVGREPGRDQQPIRRRSGRRSVEDAA